MDIGRTGSDTVLPTRNVRSRSRAHKRALKGFIIGNLFVLISWPGLAFIYENRTLTLFRENYYGLQTYGRSSSSIKYPLTWITSSSKGQVDHLDQEPAEMVMKEGYHYLWCTIIIIGAKKKKKKLWTKVLDPLLEESDSRWLKWKSWWFENIRHVKSVKEHHNAVALLASRILGMDNNLSKDRFQKKNLNIGMFILVRYPWTCWIEGRQLGKVCRKPLARRIRTNAENKSGQK